MKRKYYLEDLDNAINGLKNDTPSEQDMLNEPVNSSMSNDPKMLEELNRIFTPVLVRRQIEKRINTDTKLELAESGQFTERSSIQFDDSATYDQLVAASARLLQKEKNTSNWQAYQKASEAMKQANINMQQEESEAAASLTKEYLLMMSKSNNSPTARDAALDLLSVRK